MAASNSSARIRHTAEEQDIDFPKEIPMDRLHFLEESTRRFLGMKDGLPELIKNSKDQYARHQTERDLRQIVVIADTETHRLAVLDFAGARADEFAGWSNWADRHANRKELSMEIEGGYGNGGKSFMVQGAKERAFLESCFEGKRTKMSFQNDQEANRFKPGWSKENGVRIDGLAEADLAGRLKGFLAQIDISPNDLPPQALAAFEKRKAFTGVLLVGVADWNNKQRRTMQRMGETIPAIISSHGQTAMTIETCDVWVIVDGKIVTPTPITPTSIPAYRGFEEPREFPIPDMLPDPEGGSVDMTKGPDGPRYLRLCTSSKQMQMSESIKARNVIRLWNERNNVASWPLQAMGLHIASVGFIYGELRCPALAGDHLSGIDRGQLNNTDLSRALEHWAKSKIRELAEELQRAMMGDAKPQDRKQAQNALEGIRDLMRSFLDPDQSGVDGATGPNAGPKGSGGTGHTYRRPAVVWGDRLDEILLEPGREEIAFALGTTIPLNFRCVERQEDGSTRPVRAPALRLCCMDDGLVSDDGDGNITAQKFGDTDIWLETESGLSSNPIRCRIVVATDVHVDPPEEPLLQGQRVKLAVTFHTSNGPHEDLLIEGSVDEPGMGQIGRGARFVAGGREGEATVRIRFGQDAQDQRSFTFQVGPDRVTPPDTNGGRGSDIPLILFCGEEAPNKEDLSPLERTIMPNENLPTIVEDVLFPNVVWINDLSKESRRVRGGRGGPTGIGKVSSRTYIQFLALKCFDILKRLHVRQSLKDNQVTENQFMQRIAYAEVECAGFVDAAWDLTEEMVKRVERSNGAQSE